MSKRILFGLFAAAILLAVPAGPQVAHAKNYILKYSDIGPPRGPRAKALMWWAEELEKRSKGQIKIKFYWGQSLVKGKETLKAVSSGLAEMGTTISSYTPADLPIWNYANAPFAITNEWIGMRTWYDLRQNVPALENEAKKKNVKVLFNNTAGDIQLLTTKTPITSIAGLQGKKIRTTGGWTHLMKALGAVPVKIGFGELYSALERGTIDGTINYIPFVVSYKHYEVAQHLTIVNMGQFLGYGGSINLKLFNEMPKNVQDILVKTSDEYMDVYAKNYIADTISAKKAMKAGIDGKKMTFHILSDADRAKWASKAEAFTSDWIAKMEKKGFDAKSFVAAVEATKTKYTKELKEKGYPWDR
jgi:TRAP-type C4-dicarboxylate transport system substrate-binding protein